MLSTRTQFLVTLCISSLLGTSMVLAQKNKEVPKSLPPSKPPAPPQPSEGFLKHTRPLQLKISPPSIQNLSIQAQAKYTKIGEVEHTFPNSNVLQASSAAAVANGEAHFSTSKPGHVAIPLPAKDKTAYDVVCTTRTTPQVSLQIERNRFETNRDVAISYAQGPQTTLLVKDPPNGCVYVGAWNNHVVPQFGTWYHKFWCAQTQKEDGVNAREQPLVWVFEELQGSQWKEVARGDKQRPRLWMESNSQRSGAIRVRYLIENKKAEHIKCIDDKIIQMNDDPRPPARYPRVVELCGERQLITNDVTWALSSCKIATYIPSK